LICFIWSYRICVTYNRHSCRVYLYLNPDVLFEPKLPIKYKLIDPRHITNTETPCFRVFYQKNIKQSRIFRYSTLLFAAVSSCELVRWDRTLTYRYFTYILSSYLKLTLKMTKFHFGGPICIAFAL
jgi:hypothetical protein